MSQTKSRAQNHRGSTAPAEERSPSASPLSTETIDLLEEIDSVLERNAEEFVKAYIQKGGQ